MTTKADDGSNPEPRVAESTTKKNIERIMCIQREAEANRTLGEMVADSFARAVGSWPFIIIQSVLLVAWVIANVARVIKPWDPYPFILLNLALSFQAAYASPIIMMSQNRQAKLADERNHLALQIELLAEQEDTETLILLRKVCDHLGIERDCASAEDLEKPTNLEELHAAICEAEREDRLARKLKSKTAKK